MFWQHWEGISRHLQKISWLIVINLVKIYFRSLFFCTSFGKKYFEIWFRKFSELATLSKQIFLWLEVVNLSDNYFQKSHFTHLKNLVERSLRWAVHFDCLATLSKDIETWVNLFEFFMTWCCKLRWNWYQNQLLDFHRFKMFKGFPISHKMWWSGNTVIKNRNSGYNLLFFNSIL